MNLDVQLLGPVQVANGNGAIALGGPKPRALLAMLALEPGSTVSNDRLVDGLWGEEPPATAPKLIQVYVSHLRKSMSAAGVDGAIVTRGHGYELAVDPAQVDAMRFERLLAQGAPREALQLWRGSPLSDVSFEPFAPAEIRRLNELHSAALEAAIDQDLQAGRHREVLPELESLLGHDPLRERLHAQRILALYRCGRQADALEAYRQARATLINDVGVEPGAELRRLHDAILRQDASIDVPVTARLADLAERTSDQRAAWRIAEDDFAAGVVELQDRQHSAAGRGELVGPPFKGLETFGVDDAEIFFGRERLVAEMVARLPGSRLLGVVGASGSGKSSLLRAGLLPALDAGVLPGSGEWVRSIIRPGRHPHRVLKEAAHGLSADAPGVLLVDQFEEVFTTCSDESERDGFIDAVVALSRDHRRRTLVILAMRADFYGHCAAYPQLSHMLDANTILVGPMRAEELRRAIELPPRAADLDVEPALVDALVADVEGEPGALPLLSTALLELWQSSAQWQADGARSLRLVSYQQSGGVQGAVGRLAEAAYTRLDPDQQQRARRLLLRLAGDGDVRLRVPLADVVAANDVILALATDRLVTVDEGHVEVAHEALLREWPRLVDWLEEDAEGRRVHRHLSASARDWAATGRDASDLYRGSRLAAAVAWAAAHDDDLNDVERDFVAAGVAADLADAESHRHTNRRLRALLAGVAGLLLLALVAGAVALSQQRQAQQLAVIADARRVAAEALTREQLDDALLLASAGAQLHPSAETHSSLLSVLLRRPAMIGELQADGWPLYAAAVSSDGSMLATSDERGRVTVYDVRTRRPLSEPYRVMADSVASLAFSPDGRTLAVTSHGQSTLIDLIDPRSGTLQRRLEVPESPEPGSYVSTTVFHPDGRDFVVTTSNVDPSHDGAPTVLARLDGDTGELRASRPVSGAGLFNLMASGDGQRLFVNRHGGDTTREFDPDTLRFLGTYPAAGDAMAVSEDGNLLAVGSDSGTVRLVDVRTGRVRPMLARHRDGVDMRMVFTPDGRTLVTSTRSGDVIIWDVATREIREQIDAHEQSISALLVSPDGRTLYTASQDARLAMWDLTGGRRLYHRFDVGSPIPRPYLDQKGLAVSPIDGTLAVEQSDGAIYLRSGKAFEQRTRLTIDGAWVAAFSADGERLAAAGEGGDVTLWDVRAARILRRVQGSSPFVAASSVAFTPDGRHVVVAEFPSGQHRFPGGVRMYDVATGELQPLKIPLASPSIAVSPDGRHVAAAGEESPAQVRDLQTSEAVAKLDTGDFSRTVAYSPDGDLLAVGHYGGSAVLLSTANYEQVGRRMSAHLGEVTALQFAPDGDRLLTGSSDGTLQLWDVATQQAIGQPLTVDARSVVSAGFTPDGDSVVAVSSSGQGLLWDVRVRAWQDHACTVAGHEFTAEEWRSELPGRPYQAICARS